MIIRPQTLWNLFRSCNDSKWIGDVCRALGRQDVDLDFGQKQMVQTIMNDRGNKSCEVPNSKFNDSKVQDN